MTNNSKKRDKSGWGAFLKHLKERGLKGVRLVISDACSGLVESVAEYYPEADWQRCTVHFYRNVFSHVPNTKVKQVAHTLKAIHAQESLAAAQGKARAVVDNLREMKLAKAAALVEQAIGETLTCYRYPDTHWRRIRTNNPLERIMREIRRRTRVVGAFPDGQSALNALRRPAQAHRGDQMGNETLPLHGGITQSGSGRTTDRMNCRQIKSAKNSGHYPPQWLLRAAHILVPVDTLDIDGLRQGG